MTQLEYKENHIEEHVEMVPNSISNEPMDNWVESFWEELKRAKDKRDKKVKDPIIEIDLG